MAGKNPMPWTGFVLFASLSCAPVAVYAQTTTVTDAQALLEADRPDEAVEVLQDLLQTEPDNTDIMRRLAQANAATGDLQAALTVINRAVAIAPQDSDLLLVRSYILTWSERNEEAREQYDAIVANSPDYPGLRELNSAIIRAESQSAQSGISGLSVTAGVSEIEFTSGASNTWYSASLRGYTELGDVGVATFGVDYEERQSSDTRLSLRFEKALGDGVLFAAVSHTPNADFREQWSLAGGGEFSASPAISLLFDARYAEYASNDVTILRPGARVRLTPRLSATGHWINLFQRDGGHRYGGSGRIDYALGGESNLYFGGAVYPDTEAGITRQVRAVFIGANQPISNRLTLYGALEYEERDQSYERTAATIGLGWRFGT